jgi:hypothetical protein
MQSIATSLSPRGYGFVFLNYCFFKEERPSREFEEEQFNIQLDMQFCKRIPVHTKIFNLVDESQAARRLSAISHLDRYSPGVKLLPVPLPSKQYFSYQQKIHTWRLRKPQGEREGGGGGGSPVAWACRRSIDVIAS